MTEQSAELELVTHLVTITSAVSSQAPGPGYLSTSRSTLLSVQLSTVHSVHSVHSTREPRTVSPSYNVGALGPSRPRLGYHSTVPSPSPQQVTISVLSIQANVSTAPALFLAIVVFGLWTSEAGSVARTAPAVTQCQAETTQPQLVLPLRSVAFHQPLRREDSRYLD